MSEDDPADPQRLRGALAEWTGALGAPHVLCNSGAVAAYGRTTLPNAAEPVAVLRPGDRDAVISIVRIALKHRIPLYPVSGGRNWGYGDACPPTPGQVLVDLSRMNRIVEVNRDLAYVVIEPGVTQGQLARHLHETRTGLWADCTGAGPDTSIVGNILERGFGHTPYGNRFQTVSGMEIVLADGAVVRTGFGHYANAQATRVYPYGVGPALDGLFAQSNFGIVTQVGLWLMPVPQRFEMFFCQIADHDDIGSVVDALRRLRLDGTLRSIVHIANDMRMLSSRPARSHAPANIPYLASERSALRAAEGIAAWSMSGSVSGSAAQVRAARAALRKALRGPGRRLITMGERKIRLVELAARVAGSRGTRLGQLAAAVRGVADLNMGRPTGQFLAGAYWRRREGVPASFPDDLDPARDQCGLMWLSPVLPMTGEAVRDLHARVEPIYRDHRFHLLATLSTVTDRALGAILTVAYDRTDPDETRRATACYEALWQALVGAGYLPYRIGIQSMAALAAGSDGFWEVAARIKDALDPAGIIAPGRYEPHAMRSQT